LFALNGFNQEIVHQTFRSFPHHVI